MAKINGLGVRCFVGTSSTAYDLSGDTNAITGIGSSQELLNVTTLEKSAMQRLAGVRDTSMSLAGWFDSATSHNPFSPSGALPTADQNVTLTTGTSRGDVAIAGAAKQANYEVDRQPNNALATSVDYEASDGYPFEWGVLLSDGPAQTDSSATNSTAVDNSAASTSGAYGILTLLSLGSGTVNIVVQTSSDNVTFADYLTFTAATGATSEIIRSSSSCARYARLKTSGTFADAKMVMVLARL